MDIVVGCENKGEKSGPKLKKAGENETVKGKGSLSKLLILKRCGPQAAIIRREELEQMDTD